MEAAIDSYTQMRVGLSLTELNQLKQEGKIIDLIWRYGRGVESCYFPFYVYLRKSGRIKAFSLPRGSDKERESYVLRLIPQAIKVIEEGKFVGFDFTTRKTPFRSVLISREDVF